VNLTFVAYIFLTEVGHLNVVLLSLFMYLFPPTPYSYYNRLLNVCQELSSSSSVFLTSTPQKEIMTKVTIDPLASGYRSSTKLNDNFDTIQAGFENTLSRDGTGPNQMLAQLDMNNNRIINAPAPTEPTDLVRLIDIPGIEAGDFTLIDYARKDGADFTGEVTVQAPVNPTNPATKTYVDTGLAAASNPSGTFTVTIQSGGLVDFTGYAGKTVDLYWNPASPFDPNVYKIQGLTAGQRVTVVPRQNTAFLFGNIDGTGQKFFGNYQATTGGHNAMAVNQKDLVVIEAINTTTANVYLTANQYINRTVTPTAGSGANPDETFLSLGYVGPYSPTKGLPWGDFLTYTNGTVGKPITKGLTARGIGDTAPIVMETYDVDVDGYAKCWADVQKIGTHLTFRTGWNDGSAVPSFTYTMPAGYGGPGSLGQGFHSSADFYASALPSGTSTPGGITLRATRAGTPTPIDVLGISQTGATLFYGKAALEAGSLGSATPAAALAALGSGLTLSNISQWHSPSLLIDRNSSTWYGTAQFISTPCESSLCDHFADMSFRNYTDKTDGVDFGYRSDENLHWWFSVDNDIRTRSFGVKNDRPGLYLAGEQTTQFARYQSWEPTIANNGVAVFPLTRANRRGHIEVIGINGNGMQVGFDLATGAVRLHWATAGSNYTTGAGVLTGTTGTAGNTTVSISGSNLYLENRAGASVTYTCEIKD
jgi:hypothetical protein